MRRATRDELMGPHSQGQASLSTSLKSVIGSSCLHLYRLNPTFGNPRSSSVGSVFRINARKLVVIMLQYDLLRGNCEADFGS